MYKYQQKLKHIVYWWPGVVIVYAMYKPTLNEKLI